MHKLLAVGFLVFLSACGSSAGAGGSTGVAGSITGDLSAPFISTGLQSSKGAWGVLQEVVSDGNTMVTIQELFVLFSSADVCSTLTNDANSTAEPESFSISLVNTAFSLPGNGNYTVANDPNDLAVGAVGLADLTFAPANAVAGGKIYEGTGGTVALTSAPSSATAGIVSGTISATFDALTLQASTDGTDGTNTQALDGNTATGNITQGGTAAGSATGTFSASYCAALSAALAAEQASESGSASDGNVQMLSRGLTTQQKKVRHMIREARALRR